MGNEKSEQKKEFQAIINHPRFTKSKIISLENEKYLQTSQAIDEKEFSKWKLSLEKFKNIPSHLLIAKKHDFSRTGLCGQTGTLLLNYDNYPYLLTEEIYNRKGKKSKFNEQEIWFLLNSILQARQQVISVGQKLGDVRPDNIFLNEEGNIKVVNSLSFPLEGSNIQKTIDKIPTFIAPEDLAKIQKNQFFDGPIDSAEAFSIGLTILSAANLTEFQNLYDLKTFKFNAQLFSLALSQWRQNFFYSIVLRGVVSLLLSLDPNRRLTCKELQQLLAKHQQFILNKQNFVIDNAPQKLHEQIQQNRLAMAPLPPPVPFGLPAPVFQSEYKFQLQNKGPVEQERQQ